MNAQTQAFKNTLHKSLEYHHDVSTSLAVLWRLALLQTFIKLDPHQLLRLLMMLVAELTAVLTTLLYFVPDQAVPTSVALQIVFWLWFTMLFTGFVGALARGCDRARIDGLKAGSQGLSANRRRTDGSFESVTVNSLCKDDVVWIQAGEIILGDDEVTEGMMAVDEAAITGESTSIIREPGGDHPAVTGNTQVVSGRLLVRIGANPGESALGRMIALAEGAKRQRTPDEVALDVLLIGLTLIFLLVVVALKPFTLLAGGSLPLVFLVALLVILVPTTISGLLSATGIAGMDRLVRPNVIAKSGRAVETTSDIHVLLLDKTGTITFGNRRCSALYTAPGVDDKELAEGALLVSLADDTPEGKSIVEYLCILHPIEEPRREELTPIAFSAGIRLPGVDWSGQVYRKGAVDAALRFIDLPREKIFEVLSREVDKITQNGGVPLLVVANGRLLGAIHLKDVIESDIRECFAGLRRLGTRTVMVTGDNPLTTVAIAAETGVDNVIAEVTPEKKLARICRKQDGGRLVAVCSDGASDAPTLAQADIDTAINDGTQAVREAANLADLDSDPTRPLDVVQVGKKLLVTRGVLTTFSIVNDVVKHFATLPALLAGIYPQLNASNVMRLQSPQSAILPAIVSNTLIIVALIPLVLRGVRVQAADASQLLQRNLLTYGVGGLVAPFFGIKAIDLLLAAVSLA